MSTLTKILIVLLTISSIFLCGIVVTYVANADNYRQKYNNLKAERDALEQSKISLTKQLNEKISETDRQKKALNNEIASLKTELDKAKNDLNTAERDKAALLQRVNSFASIVEGFTKTNDHQGLLLKNTINELSKVQAQQIKDRKELKETTTTLINKMAIIKTLETEKKRLLEDKSELQSRLDELLKPAGKRAAPPVPVTPEIGPAQPAAAAPSAKDISLKGLVTAVDLKNSMASISIGAADGVKEGMKFHVTRGDEFICDILIIDVDAEEAVGILELVQQQLKVGDNASTNL